MKTWTPEETKLLISNYGTATNERLAELFPDKTPYAIYKKAYKLGMRKSPEVEWQNRSNARKGEKSSSWNGGIKKTAKGYRMVLRPGHHRADRNGYVMEHILVFEQATGIIVPDNCCIHHLNGVKSDNRIENLCMMTRNAHTVFHHTGQKRSEQTKRLLSDKARERFSDERNHPAYKDIDAQEMIDMRNNGHTVKHICEVFGIDKKTYYRKVGKHND